MKDQGSISIAFDQITDHLPVSSPKFLHYQHQKQLSQYSHQVVPNGHHHCQHQSVNVPSDNILRQGQTVSVGSAIPNSVVEARKMSSGVVRRVSREDIQLVQHLIERCLQLYMNQKEVVYTLLDQAKIEPGFTELVWQKLEEENREFFKAYHVRLMVKNQILVFNKLLEEQVELMQNVHPTTTVGSNGSHAALQRNSCFAMTHSVTPSTPDKIHQPVGGHSSILINGGGTTMSRNSHGINEVPAHNGRMDISSNMHLAQNGHLTMLQGANGVAIKSEPGFSNDPAFTFGNDSNVMETRPTIADASTCFSSTESNSQALNGALLDADISSYGFLGQIPRSFSLSDLTADFSHSSDILESYPRSPFLAPDTDDFLDSPERECQGEERRLDTISEGRSYDEFGSD